jgi:hypothetical protein
VLLLSETFTALHSFCPNGFELICLVASLGVAWSKHNGRLVERLNYLPAVVLQIGFNVQRPALSPSVQMLSILTKHHCLAESQH